MCHYNADCVTVNNSVDPEKVCRCKPGYTGQGVICSGELNGTSACMHAYTPYQKIAKLISR